VVDLVVWMLAGWEVVTKQHFITTIGVHRTAVILGAVTGKFAAMTIDPDGALGRIRIGTNIKGKRRQPARIALIR
jgi:hypothetical protein